MVICCEKNVIHLLAQNNLSAELSAHEPRWKISGQVTIMKSPSKTRTPLKSV